jgi:hypothetical protein
MPESPNSTTAWFLDELFAIQRENSFRDPMFNAVRSGSMTPAVCCIDVAGFACCSAVYTLHKRDPRELSHRDAQQLLAENLWEEHGRGVPTRDHYALIRKLAHGLGATDRDLDDAQPLKETAEYINHCLKVTRELSFVESMTAIALGIEIFMPAFFGALGRSLCLKYGVSRDHVDYLMVHIAEDETHSLRAIALIEAYADTPDVREKAKDALREMLVKRRFAVRL